MLEKVKLLKEKINEADGVLIGAASGMSAAAGYNHYYERSQEFVRWFSDFEKKYGYHNSFGGFYHPYRSEQERWAYLGRMAECILNEETGEPYFDLKNLLDGKAYHILTTNQDGQFFRLFPEEKISAIQGDWRYIQCGHRCHDRLYRSEEIYAGLNEAIDENLVIDERLVPRCPQCGAVMEPWVRGPVFLEGEKYYEEYRKVRNFITEHRKGRLLLIELGVGRMTPMFIQEPFWDLTYSIENAFYITINPRDAIVPREIEEKSLAIKEDIAAVLKKAVM